MTTSCLIIYRAWKDQEDASTYDLKKSIPFSHLFVESATLQLGFEVVLLALYSADINAQYIFLESITPVIVSLVKPTRPHLGLIAFI